MKVINAMYLRVLVRTAGHPKADWVVIAAFNDFRDLCRYVSELDRSWGRLWAIRIENKSGHRWRNYTTVKHLLDNHLKGL